MVTVSNTYSSRPPDRVGTTTRKSVGQLVWSGRRCSGAGVQPADCRWSRYGSLWSNYLAHFRRSRTIWGRGRLAGYPQDGSWMGIMRARYFDQSEPDKSTIHNRPRRRGHRRPARQGQHDKLAKAVREFGGYLAANASAIPNYGERYRAGEIISTSFVESAVNQVISKRMVKKQQMRWSPRGAHLLTTPDTHPGTQRHPRRRLPALVPPLHPPNRSRAPGRV